MFSSSAVSTGSQRSVAASSCKDIYSRGDSTGDGFYWLNSNGTEAPYVTFCNMTSGGGNNIKTLTFFRVVLLSQLKVESVIIYFLSACRSKQCEQLIWFCFFLTNHEKPRGWLWPIFFIVCDIGFVHRRGSSRKVLQVYSWSNSSIWTV